MSGVTRRQSAPGETKVVERYNVGDVIVDPTIDIAQPGGPFPVGHAILADGMGGYTIDATYRSYLLTLYYSALNPPLGSTLPFEVNGVPTDRLGPSLPFNCHIIGYSASTNNDPAAVGNDVELRIACDSGNDRMSHAIPLKFDGERVLYNRSLAIEYRAGSQIFASLTNNSRIGFTDMLLTLELQI